MPKPTNLLLPDDEHYYFGVELPCSPEEVRERLLRKPEYLYSLTSVDEDEGETYRTWLYLWRCNEGWDSDMWHLSSAELWKMECASHNMRLRVVLHALTEGEALNPATLSERVAHSYVLVTPPHKAGGNKTIPQLNLGRTTGNRNFTELHVISPAELPSLYEDCIFESSEPDEVPQEVIDSHTLMYIRRARTVMKSIHDADSMSVLLPLREEYESLANHLLKYADKGVEEFQHVLAELGQIEYNLLLQPWYVGCHHQRHTHPSGLVLCATYPPHGEYRRELLDFYPGRKLCYKESEGRVEILPATEGDTPLPQREGGRFHILPDDCLCGQYRDEHDHIIRWVDM